MNATSLDNPCDSIAYLPLARDPDNKNQLIPQSTNHE